ncbi:MAG: hypothetical protein ACRDUV_22205, partial [Pseudonocardiaceae bacterium]
ECPERPRPRRARHLGGRHCGRGKASVSCPTVLAARYRPGVGAQASHPVHLLPLPVHAADSAAGALCGALLSPQNLETVEPGQGTPCSMCVRQQAATIQAPTTEEAAAPQLAGPSTGLDGTAYCALGWPVRLQDEHVVLPLGHCATAQIVPMDLVEAITPILTALDRPAPVMLHPDAPGCGVVIAGEPYGVPLPWPDAVQVVTGMLALPPSETPHGPVRWYGQAPAHPLATCREIDIFAAVRTAGQAAHGPQGRGLG